MKNSLRSRLQTSVLVLGLAFGPALAAQVVLVVPRYSPEVFLPGQQLLQGPPFDLNRVSWTPATRGTLSGEAGGLRYVPDDPEFWEAGVDSFRIYHPHMTPTWKTVHLVSDLREQAVAVDAIVGCQLGEGWRWGQNTGDNIRSDYGDGSECAFEFTLGRATPEVVIAPIDGGGPGGGHTSITVDPGEPWGGGGPTSTVQVPTDYEVVLAAAQLGDGTRVFELALQEGPTLVARAFLGDGSDVSTDPIEISHERQVIDLVWWFPNSAVTVDGGLLLLKDGELLGAVEGVDNFAFLHLPLEWKFGSLEPSLESTGSFYVLDPEVWTSASKPVYEPLFSDSATDGTLDGWSDVVNPHKVSVLRPFPGGDRELSLAISGAEAVTLRDDSPDGEHNYHGSFDLGVEGLQGLNGVTWTLFAAGELMPTSAYPPFRLQVRRRPVGEGFEIRAQAADSENEVVTPWVPIATSQSRVKVSVHWWAAPNPLEPEGGLVLSLDDTQRAELQGLANSAARVDHTHLGAQDLFLGIVGQLILDDFVAWR